jgi:hypothetical protein
MVTRIWFITPLIHSDDISHHSIAYSQTETLRCEVEAISGKSDPYRTRDKDIYTFFNMMVEKPPEGKIEDFMFWFCAVIDAHKPIIEYFGRYPYQNVALGRVSSDEEEMWLRETGGGGMWTRWWRRGLEGMLRGGGGGLLERGMCLGRGISEGYYIGCSVESVILNEDVGMVRFEESRRHLLLTI